tara:strand:+ start:298 stop:498 length:201 start_codon:yes stop_codon:yes gene_type:complete
MVLNDNLQVSLRQKGVITENEIALKTGDIYIAEHVLDLTRRVLDNSHFTGELTIQEASSKKSLLKG